MNPDVVTNQPTGESVWKVVHDPVLKKLVESIERSPGLAVKKHPKLKWTIRGSVVLSEVSLVLIMPNPELELDRPLLGITTAKDTQVVQIGPMFAKIVQAMDENMTLWVTAQTDEQLAQLAQFQQELSATANHINSLTGLELYFGTELTDNEAGLYGVSLFQPSPGMMRLNANVPVNSGEKYKLRTEYMKELLKEVEEEQGGCLLSSDFDRLGFDSNIHAPHKQFGDRWQLISGFGYVLKEHIEGIDPRDQERLQETGVNCLVKKYNSQLPGLPDLGDESIIREQRGKPAGLKVTTLHNSSLFDVYRRKHFLADIEYAGEKHRVILDNIMILCLKNIKWLISNHSNSGFSSNMSAVMRASTRLNHLFRRLRIPITLDKYANVISAPISESSTSRLPVLTRSHES